MRRERPDDDGLEARVRPAERDLEARQRRVAREPAPPEVVDAADRHADAGHGPEAEARPEPDLAADHAVEAHDVVDEPGRPEPAGLDGPLGPDRPLVPRRRRPVAADERADAERDPLGRPEAGVAAGAGRRVPPDVADGPEEVVELVVLGPVEPPGAGVDRLPDADREPSGVGLGLEARRAAPRVREVGRPDEGRDPGLVPGADRAPQLERVVGGAEREGLCRGGRGDEGEEGGEEAAHGLGGPRS